EDLEDLLTMVNPRFWDRGSPPAACYLTAGRMLTIWRPCHRPPSIIIWPSFMKSRGGSGRRRPCRSLLSARG
ncbi:MAG TPA: hypothetical protein VEO02_14985, partial [Thermoanaerobaculia bacterium]|nr:hypothetical protein [Thermoanaerobaculia bacterium]